MSGYLSCAADAASVATAIVAVWAWASYLRQHSKRTRRLEAYLEKVRAEAIRNPAQNGEGMRSLIHLMAHLYMTEGQVYEAAFASNKIKSWPRNGRDGVADQVMFQFNPVARAEG